MKSPKLARKSRDQVFTLLRIVPQWNEMRLFGEGVDNNPNLSATI
jgi:hypothetical protein